MQNIVKTMIVNTFETACGRFQSDKEAPKAFLVTFGLKGMAAYAKHADVLDKHDPAVDNFLQEALAKTLDDSLSVADLVALTLETGNKGVSVMALLDAANTGTYGNPEITKVNIGVGTNPGILVSGHDLHDPEMLLKQT